MNRPANQFERLAKCDTDTGLESAQMLQGRAGELQAALRPLDSIAPVLSSLYLVKGWLGRRTSSLVYGESNVGKTFFALDVAMHVAAGKAWHGAKVACDARQPSGVVYVAGEGGSGMHNRIEAMRRHNPALVEQAEAQQGFTLLPTMLDLCGATDARELVTVFDTLPARLGLVVVDTLARTMGDGDENTARDMGAFVRNLDHIRNATGAHVMVIHHSGKDATKGARGSGSLRAAVDTEIHLTRSGSVIMAETRKQRDMQIGKVFAYLLRDVEIGGDEDGEPVTSAVVEQTEPVARRRVSGKPAVALQALSEALIDQGKTIAGPNYPTCPVVSLDAWKAMCGRHGLTGSENPEAIKKSFQRARTALLEKGLVRQFDGYAWMVSSDD